MKLECSKCGRKHSGNSIENSSFRRSLEVILEKVSTGRTKRITDMLKTATKEWAEIQEPVWGEPVKLFEVIE